MNDQQKEFFKIVLQEVLNGISKEEFGDLIDTFIELYEVKFGKISIELEDEPESEDVLHVNDASDYLKKFRL